MAIGTMTRPQPTGKRPRLRVDRIDCDGYGMCAELLPELIRLDDWGYPILRDLDVPDVLVPLAERAVAVCPVLALHLDRRTDGDVADAARRVDSMRGSHPRRAHSATRPGHRGRR